MPSASAEPGRRVELTLTKPPIGWYPKPTVIVEGRGQPAQWGTGTWQVEPGTTLGVFLFNRMWRFGAAETVVGAESGALSYRAPWLPFGRGRLVARR